MTVISEPKTVTLPAIGTRKNAKSGRKPKKLLKRIEEIK
jgi:hypothetical protein